MPAAETVPKTVKPPLTVSRLFGGPLLSIRLMNHWLVALSGSSGSFAIAIVPRTLCKSGRASFGIGLKAVTGPGKRTGGSVGSWAEA